MKSIKLLLIGSTIALNVTAQNAAGCIDTTTYNLQFGQRFEYILDVNGQCPGKKDGNIQLEMLSAGQFIYTLNNQEIALINNQISNLELNFFTILNDIFLNISSRQSALQQIE